MSKWRNWEMEGESLKKIITKSQQQNGGTAEIYTVLNHVSSSGMTRYISAYIPIVDEKGAAQIVCIARERRVSGCGMDMGFELVYNMYFSVMRDDDSRQGYGFNHHWM